MDRSASSRSPVGAWGAVVFGLLLMVAGFLAAFTTVGAMSVDVGIGLLIFGVLRACSVPTWIAGTISGLVASTALLYTLFVYP